MIKKTIQCFMFEFSQLIKNILFWIILASNFGYLCIIYFVYYNRDDLVSALTSAAFAVNSGMLFFLLLAFMMNKKESLNSCDEVFSSTPNGYVSKLLGKVIVIVILDLAATTSSLLIFFILCFKSDTNRLIYLMALKYHILFWFIPFFICGIIGLIIGQIMSSKKSYILILLIWLIISATNVGIFKIISTLTRIEMSSLRDFLTLSQTDIHASYNSLYGVPMEINRWIHGLILTILSLYVLYLIIYFKQRAYKYKQPAIVSIVFVLTLSILANFYLRPSQLMLQENQNKSTRKYDPSYYAHNTNVNYKNKNDYTIDSYSINLKVFQQLDVDVSIIATIVDDTDSLIFTLYHDLNIRKIIFKGSDVKFIQKGDQVLVKLPERKLKGNKLELDFVYTGTSSPLFFANNQAIMLPGYFPWLPTEGSSNAMIYNDGMLYRQALNPKHSIKYLLNYSGKNNICTNLKQTQKNRWEGVAPNGITIASGMITETVIDGISVCYPVDIKYPPKSVSKHLEYVNKTQKNIANDLSITVQNRKIEKVFYLPIPEESILYSTMWDLNDHIIFDITKNNDVFSDEMYNMIGNLGFMIKNKDILKQNQYAVQLFMETYAYWYSIKNNTTDSEYNLLKRSAQSTIYENKNEIKLKNIIDKHKDNEIYIKNFFKKFLTFINSSKLTDDELIQYLNTIGGE